MPAGSIDALTGAVPAAKGDPFTGASAPVLASIVKAETLLDPVLGTYANLPVGSTATPKGELPAPNGDPSTCFSAPLVALMVFYLIPVCFVSWFAGRWPGILISLVSCAIWYAAKYLDPGSINRHGVLLWNTLQRFGLFSLLAVLTSEVSERKRVEQALQGIRHRVGARR